MIAKIGLSYFEIFCTALQNQIMHCVKIASKVLIWYSVWDKRALIR